MELGEGAARADSARLRQSRHVAVQPISSPIRLGATTLEAARASGLPTFQHPNGKMMERDGGAAIVDVIVSGARRQSVFRSYVYPILDSPNLTVLTQTLVTRLSIEDKSGYWG